MRLFSRLFHACSRRRHHLDYWEYRFMADLTRLNTATAALNVSADRLIQKYKDATSGADQAAIDEAAAAVETVTANIDLAAPAEPEPPVT